jgi:PIN domain nuclease of toxin-antitoxin system
LRLLLDTHAALWLLSEDERMPTSARALVFDESVDCFLSAASVWEVAIKRSMGKLNAPANFHVLLEQHGVTSLPVYDSHAAAVADLPLHHRDPFDRMLVVQAQADGMPILSKDEILHAYDVTVLW